MDITREKFYILYEEKWIEEENERERDNVRKKNTEHRVEDKFVAVIKTERPLYVWFVHTSPYKKSNNNKKKKYKQIEIFSLTKWC